MRNDTLDNWRSSNPVLMAGEWGIAIDSRTGKSVVKVGDGVHHWNDLSLELGKKEANTYSHSYAKGDYSTRDYCIRELRADFFCQLVLESCNRDRDVFESASLCFGNTG